MKKLVCSYRQIEITVCALQLDPQLLLSVTSDVAKPLARPLSRIVPQDCGEAGDDPALGEGSHPDVAEGLDTAQWIAGAPLRFTKRLTYKRSLMF